VVELEGAVVKNCLVPFTYTDPIGGAPRDVYVNPFYVTALREYSKGQSAINIEGSQYPVLVDGDPPYVYGLLEAA
jgi:hypothetical protein